MRVRWLSPLALLAVLPTLAAAATPTMPVSQIKPGMMAIGKSVFTGTTIEDFNMRILGVAQKARQGRDVIMAEVLDGPVVKAGAGILAGMSGSPVYINGRLIGAIAFSWSFAKAPIAGITPVADMLSVLRDGEPAAPAKGASTLGKPLVIHGQTYHKVLIQEDGRPQAAPGTITLRPAGTVMLASGFGERGMKRLQELFAPYHAEVLQGAGGQADPTLPATLAPGAAVGVQMVRGDFDVSAFGTVTWRDGNKLLAFGHPMLSLGGVSLPMTTSTMLGFVPSYNMSFKLGAAVKTVGAISQDGLWAIGGAIGPQAAMTPVTITVKDTQHNRDRTYHVEVVRDRRLAPSLILSTVLDAIDCATGFVGRGTARVTFDLTAENKVQIKGSDLVYGEDASAQAASELMEPLLILANNPYGPLELDRLEVSVELTPGRHTALVKEVTADRPKVRAGESLTVSVQVEPYDGQPFTKTMTLPISPDTPPGLLRIGVAGGLEGERLKQMLGMPKPMMTNLGQVINEFQGRERADQVVLMAALPSRGVSVDGQVLPTLPRTVESVLSQAKSSGLRTEPDRVIERLPLPGLVVAGRQVLTVQVDRREGVAPRPTMAPPPAAAPSGEQPAGGDEEDGGPEEAYAGPLDMATAPATGTPARVTAATAKPTEQKTDTAEVKGKKPEETAKALSREPAAWLHSTESDFRPGQLEGTTLDSKGRLSLARAATDLGSLPGEIPWSIAESGGQVYVGSATSGKIYRLEEGKAEPFFDTKGVMVTALAPLPDGGLAAASAPDGTLWRLGADGKVRQSTQCGRSYLWAVAPAADGTVWAAVGSPAGVCRLGADGKVVTTDLEGTHALSLALDPQGGACAGTSDGIVYRVAPDGGCTAVLATDDAMVTGLAFDKAGALWAGTSPRGIIYRLAPGQQAERLAELGGSVYALAAAADGIYATGREGSLARVDGEGVTSLAYAPKQGQAVSLAVAADGALCLGVANPSQLVRLGPGYAASGTYRSAPLDARDVARWGMASWEAEAPAGVSVKIETRSGNSPDPNDGWSAWSAPIEGAITSPAARYLQYRLLLAGQPTVTPAVTSVRLSYLPRNHKPTLAVVTPKPAAACVKSLAMQWKGEDPDKDTLLYTIEDSKDGGATWQVVKEGLAEAKYTWDLAKVAEGRHLVRITATDSQSRPGDPTSTSVTVPITVDSTAPLVMIARPLGDPVEGKLTVRGSALDKEGTLRGVDWRVDDGDWRAAAIQGDVVEASSAGFTFTTSKLAAGKHTIEVRAFDQAGNKAGDKREVSVK